MKIFDSYMAPNPRRVRIVLAEKGLSIPIQEVNIAEKENKAPDFLTLNSLGAVPVLELDDGTYVSESLAICRYLEALHPQPVLFGTAPTEKACVEMWIHRVEFELFQRVTHCFQNIHKFFSDRLHQVPECGEVSREQARTFLGFLDQQLESNAYIAGDSFSMADASALCALDFGRAVNICLKDEHANLCCWHEKVSRRSSSSV